MLTNVVNMVEPKAKLKYNKFYIGLEVDEAVRNFVTFNPRKKHVVMTFKLPRSKEVDDQLTEADLDALAYDSQFKQYRVKLGTSLDDKQRDVLLSLTRQAWEGYGKG